jgi:hypothetical protein
VSRRSTQISLRAPDFEKRSYIFVCTKCKAKIASWGRENFASAKLFVTKSGRPRRKSRLEAAFVVEQNPD